MNKKAFELAINFLILLILSIVVFGYSVSFLYDIYGGLSEMQEKSTAELDSQIQQVSCAGNQKVCPAVIQGGKMQRKDFKSFGLRILNTKKVPSNFQVQVTQGIVPEDGEDIFFTYREQPRTLTLNPGEEYTLGIGVEIPKDATEGNYVLNVKVSSEEGAMYLPYGDSKVYKLYVEVI